MMVDQITDRIYANTTGEGRGNLGAICLSNYVAVVDSGMYPAVAENFRSYIEKTTGKPVTSLILTHYHGDHVFGSQVFKDCRIISSRSLYERMREVALSDWTRESLEETAKTRPDTYGKLDLDVLEITYPTELFDTHHTLEDDGFKIMMKKVCGHTAGSSYVYFPHDRVIFAGDLIFAHTFPWGGDPTVDPDDWIEALREFQKMSVEKIIPGHGPVCDLREVQIYLNYFEEVVRTIKELISEGRNREEVVGFEGYPEFYPSANPEWRKNTLAQWYHVYELKMKKGK